MCRRSESDCVHSQRRSQAAVRESSTGMAVTLAQDSVSTPVRPGRGAAVSPPSPARLTGAQPPTTSTGSIKLEKFVIEGGVPLSGTITATGNKNGALPILAACLLTDDEVILRNVPRISDVEAMVTLLEMLGARVEWLGSSEVLVDSSTIESTRVDRSLAERIRASFLLGRSAPRPLRLRHDATARRRRDRPPAPGPASGRVPRAGRAGRRPPCRHRRSPPRRSV